MAATAATATMPPIMMILRIAHYLRVVRNCAMH
jgi:predicted component of type VI protein secretion system